ncbi:MAG: hypothetical protein ACR2QU_08945, partial [Gammaproteobacteria bacterium]
MTLDQTHWTPTRQRGPLPTFYYHEHFVEMLEFVSRHYPHAFLEQHALFIEEFRLLPRDAQCLYVRLVNRKGRVFAKNRIRYPELGPSEPLLELLEEGGWVGRPDSGHIDDILTLITRGEIYRALLPHYPGVARSLRKPELIEFVRENFDPEQFMHAVDTSRFVIQRRVDTCGYLLYLYFGRIQEGLSRFTMRDLGLVRTQLSHENFEPRFSDRAEALEHYYYARRLYDCDGPAGEAANDLPTTNFPGSAALRDELAYALGKKAEDAGDMDTALAYYKTGESAACSERVARILLARDDRNQAREYLEACIDAPRSEE